MHMHFEMANNSFSFFGDYLNEWDNQRPPSRTSICFTIGGDSSSIS
jgi:hypothetical protein